MASPTIPSSSTDTSTAFTNTTTERTEGHLFDEEPTTYIAPQPPKRVQPQQQETESSVEETPEDKAKREKDFDKFVKRFLKVDGVKDIGLGK